MEVLAYDDDLGPTAEEVKTSLQDDVALAFKTCNAQWKRIAELERQIAEARKAAEWTLIDEEHLPQVGDEVLNSSTMVVAPVCHADVKWAGYGLWLKSGWTYYYRAINPPAKEPA